MKGLPRSLARASASVADVVKLSIPIDSDLSFTGATGAVIYQTAVIAGLPQGNILLLGAVSYVKLTGPTSANLSDTFDGDYGIGTAPTLDNDLGDAGDDNIIPSTAFGAATAEVSPLARGISTVTEQGAILDNTDGSLELNLNVLLDANNVTDSETVVIRAQGVLEIAFIVLGDN